MESQVKKESLEMLVIKELLVCLVHQVGHQWFSHKWYNWCGFICKTLIIFSRITGPPGGGQGSPGPKGNKGLRGTDLYKNKIRVRDIFC